MKTNKPDLVLIDFDGVISKNSPEIILDFFHESLNEFTPVSKLFIKNFLRLVASFPLSFSIDYLLNSLGIASQKQAFYKKLKETKRNMMPLFEIDEDFYEFIDFCKTQQIYYKIFSLADEEHLSILKLDKEDFYSLEGSSKADLNTFESVKKHLKLSNLIYIDDSPMGLRTGKLCGLTTVMMLNNLLNEEDYLMFKEYIDHKVTTFKEIENIILSQRGSAI